MDINILGISAHYHDSAAALISNGKLIAAAQEERFTRIKHDPSFPLNAIQFCIAKAGLTIDQIDYVTYYDHPIIKFERILKMHIENVPRSFFSYIEEFPKWMRRNLFLKQYIYSQLKTLTHFRKLPHILFTHHHHAHAAAAFYPSPFNEAAVLCLDGVGEWATSSTWYGCDNKLTALWELQFPDSLGLLYSAFTQYCGFKVNFGEYKLMGLAPFGEPKYVDLIKKNLIDIKADGTFKINTDYFNYISKAGMISDKFIKLFGEHPREPESPINKRDTDLAASIQVVTEEVVVKLTKTLLKETNCRNLCLAGGVALNCVANGKLAKLVPSDRIWVQPAAGDAGSALGAAYITWHSSLKNRRMLNPKDSMQSTYLGPEYSNHEIQSCLEKFSFTYKLLGDQELISTAAKYLADSCVIGWFQGRMEFGPRALGNRSILADPRDKEMQKKLNSKIKKRESFRPFAPAVLDEKKSEYFDFNQSSPYMQFVSTVKSSLINEGGKFSRKDDDIMERIKYIQSEIPAVTHVDFTARIQTVERERNPKFWSLINAFCELTSCAVLVNTSFNVRGEPIVCSPLEALGCFMETDMDCLFIGNYLLEKSKQHNVDRGLLNENRIFEMD